MGKIMSLIDESENRSKKAKKNSLLLLLFKGGSIIISFFYVPLLLNSLSSCEYAVWLTLTSIVGWLVVADIGLGNGLRNKLAESLANEDVVKGRKYISTAYLSLAAILIAITVSFLLISRFVSWCEVLNSDCIDSKELNFFVLIVFISFCIQFGLSLLNSVLLAIQMPAISSALGFIGQIISFTIVLLLVKIFNQSSLIILGSAISIIPVVVYILANFIFFRIRRDLSPSFKHYNRHLIKDILSLGVKFFFLQVIGIVLFYSNNLIITHSIGTDAVVEYNIAYKYMNFIYMVFTIVSTPIWSATTEAYAKGDISWIKKTNRTLLRIVGILTVLGCIMLLASHWIFKIWLGDTTYCKADTLVMLMLYFIFLSLYGCYGFILNGIGKLKIQIIATSVLAILYIPLAFYCGRIFGLNGILMVFLINQLVNFGWSRYQYCKIIESKATGIWNE